MKTVTKSVTVPVTIRIVDKSTGKVLGEATTNIEIQYTYEVPDLADYLLKGAAPGTIGSILVQRYLLKK